MPEQAVAYAAAGEQDAVDVPFGGQITTQRGGNVACHEMSGRAEQVMEPGLMLACLLESLLRELLGKGLPRQAARRPALQGGVGQPRLDERLNAFALDRVAAAGIETLPARPVTPGG